MGRHNSIKSIVQEVKDNRPTISLLLTMRCNFACAHCFYNCGPDLPGDYMDNEILNAVHNQVVRLKRIGTYPTINLIGGEPTLDMARFEQILDTVTRWETDVSVVTNGWWLADVTNIRAFLSAVGKHVDPNGYGISGDYAFAVRISNDKYHDRARPQYLKGKGLQHALNALWEPCNCELYYDSVPVCAGCGEELESTDEPTSCCDSYVEFSEEMVVDTPPEPNPGDPWIHTDTIETPWGTPLNKDKYIIPIGRGYNIARNMGVGCHEYSNAGDLSYTPDGKLMDICCKGSKCEFGTVYDDPLLLLALGYIFTEEVKPYCYECHDQAKDWAAEHLKEQRQRLEAEIERWERERTE